MHREQIKLKRPLRDVKNRQPTVNVVRIQREAQSEQAAYQRTQESLATLLGELKVAVEELELRRQQSLEELQTVAVELAVAAAANVVRQAIDENQFGVSELVAQTINRVVPTDVGNVRLHPEDVELLKSHASAETFQAIENVLKADATLQRGTVLVEEQTGRIAVTEVITRLEDIRKLWLGQIHESQIERRQTQTDAESLKRFPDRRETA